MWSNKYIGIPFQDKGRDFNGIDCWGLARLVYQEQYNITLPSFSSEYEGSDTLRMQELIAQYKEGWEQIPEPIEGALVLFRVLGSETHIGIAVSPTHFLHARDGHDSAIESLESTGWKNRIVGYFKYSKKKGVILNAVPHPLRTERFTTPIPPGTNLQQLVSWATKEWNIAEELKSSVTIIVNGRVVDKADWATTILRDNDTVEYRAVPGKDAARIVLVMAVALAAPYLATNLLFPALELSAAGVAGAFKLAPFAMAATTAAVSLVGNALVNVIAPVRVPTQNDPGSSEQMLMVTGGANRPNPYGAIPVILGKVRVTPPLGANNYLTYENERDSYLSMLLVWGYGPLNIDAATLKIGEVALTDYIVPSVVTLDRKTTVTAEQQKLFDAVYGSDVTQIQSGVELTCPGNPEAVVAPGPYLTAASTEGVDQFTVSIHFPQGLRKIKTKGNGAGDSTTAPVSFTIQYKIGTGNYTEWKTFTVGSDAPKKDGFTISETLTGLNTTQTVTVQVRRNTGTNTEDNPNERYSHQSMLVGVTFIRNSTPAVDPKNCTIAKTAIKIKASEQLNGQIEGINAIVQTWCLSWNGTAWTYAATSNPADLFRYILQHPANPRRITDSEVSSKINLTQLQYWSNYCTTKGFTYNSVMASQRSILEVLRDICAAGRASPALVDGKWTVNIDEPKSTVIQHFSPHNSWGFEGTKSLPKFPDGLRVTYYDEDQDYQQAEIIVYTPGQDQNTAELFESIQLPGVTKKSLVIDHARWHMAQAKLRPEVYTLNSDIEYLVCNRGDRVKVTHDVPMWGLGSGRIKNRISSTVFELDEPVPIAAASQYTVRVRGVSGSTTERTLKTSFTVTNVARTSNVVTVTLSGTGHPLSVGDIVTVASSNSGVNTSTATVTAVTSTTFSYTLAGANITSVAVSGSVTLNSGYYYKIEVTASTTLAEANALDLFLFGELNQESQDLIVLSIEPSTNKTARITLIDYGVTDTYNIFTDYTTFTAATVFESQITLPPLMLQNSFAAGEVPTITQIRSDESVADIISPGTYAYNIKISYTNIVELPKTVTHVECQYDYSSSTSSANYRSILVNYMSGSITIPAVMKGEIYKVRVRYVGNDGRTGAWSAFQNHTVIGRINNYSLADSVSVRRTGRLLTITPVVAVKPTDFNFFEARVFKDAGSGDFWTSTDASIKKVIITGSSGTVDLKDFSIPRLSDSGTQYRVACRIVDTAGNYSATSTLATISLTKIAP
jgi:hypothetical protein